MAAVYEAQHKNHSRVAVKILHRRLGLSVEQVARFQREGYAANRVGHPGIAEVYDDDIDEQGSAFLVMELLSGQSVAERATANGRLPAPEVLAIADDVLDVLSAAHDRGILHRDIKPENLFLTESGNLKVLDFGIARLADSEFSVSATEAGTVLGTPAFVPPEQARGLINSIDARTDIWAVGATMFTLLTGRYVHEAATPNEQLGLAMTASARSLAEVLPAAPAALVGVVDRALAYSPEARWPNARAMQEAVRWARNHWAEIATSPDLVPEEWVVAPPELGTTDTLGDEEPLSSTSAPATRSRPATLAMTTAAVVIIGAIVASWMAASSRHESAPQPPTALREARPTERLDPPLAKPETLEHAVTQLSPEAMRTPTVSAAAVIPVKRPPAPARVRPSAEGLRSAGVAAFPTSPSASPELEPGPRDLYDRRH